MTDRARLFNTPTLPNIRMTFANARRKALGSAGEMWVAGELSRSNWSVSFTKSGEHRGDLRAVHPVTGEILKIEVKTARQGRDKKWRFTLVKHGCTDYRHSDVLVLLCALAAGDVVAYVMRTDDIPNRRQITISSHPANYSGIYAKYRQTGRLSL